MTKKGYFVILMAYFFIGSCAPNQSLGVRKDSCYTFDSISSTYFPCIRFLSPECIAGSADREVYFYNRFDVCLPLAKVKTESLQQTNIFYYPDHQVIGIYTAHKGYVKRFPWNYKDGVYNLEANEAESVLVEFPFTDAADKVKFRKNRRHRFIVKDNVYVLLCNIKEERIEEYTLIVNGTLKVYMGEREKQLADYYRQKGYIVNGEK